MLRKFVQNRRIVDPSTIGAHVSYDYQNYENQNGHFKHIVNDNPEQEQVENFKSNLPNSSALKSFIYQNPNPMMAGGMSHNGMRQSNPSSGSLYNFSVSYKPMVYDNSGPRKFANQLQKSSQLSNQLDGDFDSRQQEVWKNEYPNIPRAKTRDRPQAQPLFGYENSLMFDPTKIQFHKTTDSTQLPDSRNPNYNQDNSYHNIDKKDSFQEEYATELSTGVLNSFSKPYQAMAEYRQNEFQNIPREQLQNDMSQPEQMTLENRNINQSNEPRFAYESIQNTSNDIQSNRGSLRSIVHRNQGFVNNDQNERYQTLESTNVLNTQQSMQQSDPRYSMSMTNDQIDRSREILSKTRLSSVSRNNQSIMLNDPRYAMSSTVENFQTDQLNNDLASKPEITDHSQSQQRLYYFNDQPQLFNQSNLPQLYQGPEIESNQKPNFRSFVQRDPSLQQDILHQSLQKQEIQQHGLNTDQRELQKQVTKILSLERPITAKKLELSDTKQDVLQLQKMSVPFGNFINQVSQDTPVDQLSKNQPLDSQPKQPILSKFGRNIPLSAMSDTFQGENIVQNVNTIDSATHDEPIETRKPTMTIDKRPLNLINSQNTMENNLNEKQPKQRITLKPKNTLFHNFGSNPIDNSLMGDKEMELTNSVVKRTLNPHKFKNKLSLNRQNILNFEMDHVDQVQKPNFELGKRIELNRKKFPELNAIKLMD